MGLLKIFCSLFLIVSCSRFETCSEKNHRAYLSYIERQKTSLSGSDFKVLMKKEIERKERELVHLHNYREKINKRLHYDETAIDYRKPHDIASFKAYSGSIEQKNVDLTITILKKELFFLRGIK